MSEEPQFPIIELQGSARTRGQGHGEQCRERIQRTVAFYFDDLFLDSPLAPESLRGRAEEVKDVLGRHAPRVAEEIEGIAEGSALPPWQVYTLNARTEILNARVPECTSLYLAETRVLAQTWDWVEPLEALCVVLRHEREDGFTYVSLVEPGMVGKIGMNSAGVGVCLNILFAAHNLSGLPVHTLIGEVLNCADFAAARARMDSSGLGKASHLLVGDGSGEAVSMEFMGDERHALLPVDGVLVHTNHCLAHGEAGRQRDVATSCARYDYVTAELQRAGAQDFARAVELLSTSAGDGGPLRPYQRIGVLRNHPVGSCATVVMELAEKRFHVRRGPQVGRGFSTIQL